VIDEPQIDRTLREAPHWEPPAGFARIVAKRAFNEIQSGSGDRTFAFSSILKAATYIVLVTIAGSLAAQILDVAAPALSQVTQPSQAATWAWVAIAYVTVAVVLRRARV
jgi:hypothetical protein